MTEITQTTEAQRPGILSQAMGLAGKALDRVPGGLKQALKYAPLAVALVLSPGCRNDDNGDDCEGSCAGEVDSGYTDDDTDNLVCVDSSGDIVETQCSDGVDNNDDGVQDADDPYCQVSGEYNPCDDTELSECDDHVDNDGDGVMDSDDSDCEDGYDGNERKTCYNDFDDDGDGWTDNEDPDCDGEDGNYDKDLEEDGSTN